MEAPLNSIRFSIDTGTTQPLPALSPFQNDMKVLLPENYLKLRNEIWETGFSFAVHVWNDGEKCYILDGHQRVECLRRMCQEMEIDPFTVEVPVVEVEAKDFKEAKRKCLAAASQYGDFKIEALQKTLAEAELPVVAAVKMFDFPMIDLANGKKFEFPSTQKEDRPIIKGDEEFSKEVGEKNNYLVFLFDDKEAFDAACAKFGVKPVISMLSREYNEKMATRGIGRVLDGKLLK